MRTENDMWTKKEERSLKYIGDNLTGDTESKEGGCSEEYRQLVAAFQKYVKARRLSTGKDVEGKLEIKISV